ncbi:hypothetical protein JW977_03650 [Candidatus Falkowbacteria bacterium]|nr:hypothetical protein [Candidatus Falkowbacteria bacterium]
MSDSQFVDGEMYFVLLDTLTEIEEEIRSNGHSNVEKARLFHQLGSIYGLMGEMNQQKFSWQKAVELDPQSKIFQQSLASLLG